MCYLSVFMYQNGYGAIFAKCNGVITLVHTTLHVFVIASHATKTLQLREYFGLFLQYFYLALLPPLFSSSIHFSSFHSSYPFFLSTFLPFHLPTSPPPILILPFPHCLNALLPQKVVCPFSVHLFFVFYQFIVFLIERSVYFVHCIVCFDCVGMEYKVLPWNVTPSLYTHTQTLNAL